MTLPPDLATTPFRIGTRGSALARAQAQSVTDRILERFPGCRTETIVISTQGDIDKISPLTEIGGRGVFTNALERELAHGHLDAAVHSAKDLPSQISPELPLAAFPEREDPRDVLVSRHGLSLDALPHQPVIGTSSRRREAQIRRMRPDSQIVSLRGNIDTRLQKSLQPDLDAIVLAAAGLHRMGWGARITQYFPVDRMVPSPGQGALAVQTTVDSNAQKLISLLDDDSVSMPVQLERLFLAAIGAGCTMPVGAHVRAVDGGLMLYAFLEDDAGARSSRREVLLDATNPAGHVEEAAREMRAEVAQVAPANWAGESYSERDLEGVRVAVTRPRKQSQTLMLALEKRGAVPLSLPTIRIEPPDDPAQLEAALRRLASGDFTWVVFTSANAVDAVAATVEAMGAREQCLRSVRAAVVGEATARAARDLGLDVAVIATQPTAEGLVASLTARVRTGEHILYPRSAIGRDVIPVAMRESGIDITVVDAYRTVPEQRIEPAVLANLRRGDVDALMFSSPSTVSSLQTLLGHEHRLIEAIPAICAGPITAAAVREAGLCLSAVSEQPGPDAMVEALAAYWRARGKAQGDSISGEQLNQLQASERMAGR